MTTESVRSYDAQNCCRHRACHSNSTTRKPSANLAGGTVLFTTERSMAPASESLRSGHRRARPSDDKVHVDIESRVGSVALDGHVCHNLRPRHRIVLSASCMQARERGDAGPPTHSRDEIEEIAILR